MRRDAGLISLLVIFAVMLGIALWVIVRVSVVPEIEEQPDPSPTLVLILPATPQPAMTRRPLEFVTPTTREPLTEGTLMATSTPTGTPAPTLIPAPTLEPDGTRVPVQKGEAWAT